MQNYLKFFLVIFLVFSFPKDSLSRGLLEGFWTGASAIAYDENTTRKPGGQRVLKIDLVISGEYGYLKIDPDVSHGSFNPFCEYYFSHDVGKVEQIVLKPGDQGQICGSNPEIQVTRKDSEKLFFNIKDSVMGLSETLPLEIRHGYVPDGERSIIPDNFTIFDLELGMLRTEVEKRLSERKFLRSVSQSRILSGSGWKQNASVYERDQNKIYILFSAVSTSDQDFNQEYAILFSRFAVINSRKKVTHAAFSNSVSLKYGPKGIGEMSRFYDYDGNLIPSAIKMLCEDSDRQDVKIMFHKHKKFLRSSVVRPFCGSGIEIFTDINKKTGLVDNYDMSFWNYDMLVDDDWRKVSYQTIENAKIYLGRLSVEHVDIDL